MRPNAKITGGVALAFIPIIACAEQTDHLSLSIGSFSIASPNGFRSRLV